MTLELFNSLATFGTFIVIAATAIAAIVQLRHLHGSNQIEALNELREGAENDRFTAALKFVTSDLEKALKDPLFRHQIANPGARCGANQELIARLIIVGNYFSSAGTLVRMGLVDKDLAVDTWWNVALTCWQALEPVVAIVRRRAPTLWDDFEYFAMLSEDWKAAHPHGTYPPGARRLEVRDEWRDADDRYAASLSAV